MIIHTFVAMTTDTCMYAGQEENLSRGKLGSQMQHERPWSLTYGCVVCCVLVHQLPFHGFFLCHGFHTLCVVVHHIS